MKSKNKPRRERKKALREKLGRQKTKIVYVERDNDTFVDLLLRINAELAKRVNELQASL